MSEQLPVIIDRTTKIMLGSLFPTVSKPSRDKFSVHEAESCEAGRTVICAYTQTNVIDERLRTL